MKYGCVRIRELRIGDDQRVNWQTTMQHLVYHLTIQFRLCFRPSMTLSKTPFEKFDIDCHEADSATALANLADYLIENERLHELFEVRKLQLRHSLGLRIEKWQAIDELPTEKGQQLEVGLVEICREIGTRFFQSGQVSEGWQYLEPVGDNLLLSSLLKEVQVTDENVEALIQLTVGQGIEAELGFQLVLERFGTCSSITTYESQLAMQPLKVRRGPASLLVQHLYRELRQRVAAVIEEHEGAVDDDSSLIQLMEGRDWLFQDMGHHVDTTHLASTVRISKIVDQKETIQQAIELAMYGTRLHEDFQYPGQTPFENLYLDSLGFLIALSGGDPATAIRRLSDLASESASFDAAIWLVYLQDQLDLGAESIRDYLGLIHQQQAEQMPGEDVCPNLMYLVSKYRQFDLAKAELTRMGDLLSYATVCSIEQQTG